jgi:FKBP-type peptidyl-prolyl cis-trans isomerase
MNKKIYYWFILLLGVTFSFVACVDNDDNNKVDEEWKQFQASEFSKTITDNTFSRLKSQSGNGEVAWKLSTDITDSDKSIRITSQGKPEFTDTVIVRYEGWYFDKAGKKYIFDSTENPSLGSEGVNPNKTKRKFGVNKVIDGWTTILQDMKVGDERLVCIPQELGYGSSTQKYIPAYTTLWFRIKLFEIIPMKATNK